MEIFKKQQKVSRSISAENFTGEKGKGGMATKSDYDFPARELGQGWKVSPAIILHKGETAVLADICGSGVIRHIWITDNSELNRSLILRMFWDNAQTPSVATPLGDFFAMGDSTSYEQMTSLKVCVNPKRGYNCYWEMPFYERAYITLENISENDIMVFFQIDYTLEELSDDCLYFHAQFNRANTLPYKEVYTLIDNVNGKGQYVGTYMLWESKSCGWWGEGEFKFFIDGDKEFPTICGTGTEDYFCGSWNYENNDKTYQTFCTPYSGVNKVIRPDGAYRSCMRFSMYRWHIDDPIFFDENIKITAQALGWRSKRRYLPLQDDISSVSYFYLDKFHDASLTLPDTDGLELL